MTAPAMTESTTDSQLWDLVRQGKPEAFELFVRRFQSLVCAVAYGACGDLATSEDVAQETFWTVWRQRETLEQPRRLGPWLCGIARNLGKNARRKAARPAASGSSSLHDVSEPSAATPGPADLAASREEEALVWGALEEIPDAYREPLILFYRENQSVANVAAALDLSEDAVKQRLSRGRGLLRERVAELVEGSLRRSRPGPRFTVAVMTGLATGAATAGAKTASAAGVGVGMGAGVAAKAGAAGAGGLLGGLMGSVFGFGGAWLGTWLPAQLAPTTRQRDLLLRAGRRILLISVLFMAALYVLIALFAGRGAYLIAWGVWFVTLQGYLAVESICLARAIQRLRAEPPGEPNINALRTGVSRLAARHRGRVHRSRFSFLGLPLIDINVRDPDLTDGTGAPDASPSPRGRARGWIAIGDEARGILLAVGSRAYGLVAVGGIAVGGLSFGGLAAGLVAVGGLGLGGLAIGGMALGYDAVGGGAIAWDVACGGFAAARQGAVGGAAFAQQDALGGGGQAAHFNDAVARAHLLQHPLNKGMEWYVAHAGWSTTALIAISLLGSIGILPLLYCRAPKG